MFLTAKKKKLAVQKNSLQRRFRGALIFQHQRRTERKEKYFCEQLKVFFQELTNKNNDSFSILRNLGQELHGSGCSWMALRGQRVERFLGEATEQKKKERKKAKILTAVPTNGT